MNTYPTEKIRNVVLFGHQGAGKTMLAEALVYLSGAINRLGKIEDGNTVCDFEPEETKRQNSVSLALAPVEWKEHKLNILDTPGYLDFTGEVSASLRVADLAVLVVSAVDGIQVGHEMLWEEAADLAIPRIVFINKMDRERASFSRTLDELTSKLGGGFAPLAIPVGEEHDFSGVADVLTGRSFTYADDGSSTEGDIPGSLTSQVEELNTKITESVVESDDTLLERYLEGEEISPREIAQALAKGLVSGTVFPVLTGAATRLMGIDLLASFIVEEGPSPLDRDPWTGTKPGTEEEVVRKPSVDEPTSLFIFKTISDPYVGRISLFRVVSGKVGGDTSLLNTTCGRDERLAHVFTLRGKDQVDLAEAPAGDLAAVAKLADTHTGDTLADKSGPVLFEGLTPPDRSLAKAIEPKTKGDEDKLMTGLQRIQEEDPGLNLERNAETHQTLLWGTGEAHLDVTMERLARKYGVEVEEVPLRIPYRETVSKPGKGLGRHVKQSGGHGQYGICNIEIEPLEREAGFEFENKIFGGAIPGQFVSSVQKGVEAAMAEGVMSTYPMVDVKVRLVDGKYHSVDSSDMAFQIAGSLALKEAAQDAGVVLLEPIMDLEVMVPDTLLGEVMGDLNTKRGRIQGTEAIGSRQLVKAKVPMSEIARYAIDLRSMTAGQGTFRIAFSHHEEVPSHVADQIIAESKKAAEE